MKRSRRVAGRPRAVDRVPGHLSVAALSRRPTRRDPRARAAGRVAGDFRQAGSVRAEQGHPDDMASSGVKPKPSYAMGRRRVAHCGIPPACPLVNSIDEVARHPRDRVRAQADECQDRGCPVPAVRHQHELHVASPQRVTLAPPRREPASPGSSCARLLPGRARSVRAGRSVCAVVHVRRPNRVARSAHQLPRR